MVRLTKQTWIRFWFCLGVSVSCSSLACISGCWTASNDKQVAGSGSGGQVNQQGQESQQNLQMADLEAIQANVQEKILGIPGIVGFGIGLQEDGHTLGFIVYCEKLTPEIQSKVPRQLQSIPVRLIESGEFKAY